MRISPLLVSLFVVTIAGAASATPTTHPAQIILVQSEASSGADEQPPPMTDEQRQEEQAYRQNANKLGGIIERHQKELKLPGVLDIDLVGADAFHEWIRVTVKELTPQLAYQLPDEIDGVWIQVVDQKRYDEKMAIAKRVMDANVHWLMKQPGVQAVGIGGDAYEPTDFWIDVNVDKNVPRAGQGIPAELGGFPVHVIEQDGPNRFL